MQFTVRGLRFRYPVQDRWAIDGVDLDIAAGEITWLTGALGSGTSTLLLALAGLAPRLTGGDREGQVSADGADLAQHSPLGCGIGYLGPSPALQISGIAANVRDEVAIGPMNLGRPRHDIEAAVTGAMQRLRLELLADRAPGALSGGETQRMLLASLLAASPRGWLLDEPFSALDHASTGHVQQLMRELADAGATIVVACEDADVMLPIADRLLVMERGRIALDGDPADLLASDAIAIAGAGTTDAAALARDAGVAAPRPLTRAALLDHLERDGTMRRPRPAAAPLANGPASVAAPVLHMHQVRFGYPGGVTVLEDLSFDIRPGEAVGLFGANGAGKSTLLRLAMALEHPSAGVVSTLGTSTAASHPEDLAPRTGFLFQEPERQLFAASVRSECGLAPRLAGWNAARVDDAVAAVLDELGLTETAEEHPYDLSLPRRRLVALAAILTADPELLLLDEPTAALDAASRDRVIGVVRERTERGKAVLAITHDAVFAHEALQRGMILERGRMVSDAPVRSVLDDRRLVRPAALVVALALGLRPGSDRRDAVVRALRVD